jgi:phosphate/sulfate permease
VLTVGSASLLLLRHGAPLWALAGVSLVFGVQNGLNIVTNQAAMYSQAPAAQTGTAAGLLRTFMYLGAIVSAAVIALAFGKQATDSGLHHLAAVLTVASVVLLAAVWFERDLRRQRPSVTAGAPARGAASPSSERQTWRSRPAERQRQ